jgi:hypothetical protein
MVEWLPSLIRAGEFLVLLTWGSSFDPADAMILQGNKPRMFFFIIIIIIIIIIIY